MSKKYILNKTNEAVKLGDKIASSFTKRTSFGEISSYKEFILNESNLKSLIDEGIIRVVDTPDRKVKSHDLTFYVKQLAEALDSNVEETTKWLDKINKICPKAILELLLQGISLDLFNQDPEGFKAATEYYSLRPKDGQVGKVVNLSKYCSVFKSAEDAEQARAVLKDQLEKMYGKCK